MAIWGSARTVDSYILKGKYDKAIELIQNQLKKERKNVRLRLQLCDVLVSAKRQKDAVPVLLGLVDELANDGFVPKAIAVLKRVQRIDPRQGNIEEKLADLCKDKDGAEMAMRTGDFQAVKRPEPVAPAAPAVPTATAAPEAPAASAGPTDMMEPNEFVETVPDMDLELDLDLEEASPTPANESPLFSDFARDELVEVIKGLNLLSYEPGDILMSEGEAGESLMVISSGSVKAWVRNADGKNIMVREMGEGEFFGEISLLSGQPRSATIVAAADCDLLELDRKTLAEIAQRQPRVREVVKDFYERRQGSESEQKARASAS